MNDGDRRSAKALFVVAAAFVALVAAAWLLHELYARVIH